MKTPEEILQQFSKLLDKAFNLFDNFEGDSTYEYANSKWYEKTTRNIINATISLFKKREQQAVDDKLQTICDYLTEHNPMPIVPDLNVSWINMFGVQWSTEDLAYIVKPKTTE